MATNQFRPPKQWCLTENEDITSFANWKSNILYHLSLNNGYARFLEGVWSKKSVANRGLAADGEEVVNAADRKSAVQKAILLEQMLGLIAQFIPSLLRNEVIKNSTSLSWIWTRLRRYYSFTKSEVNFLKLASIKRKDSERYETFYQRILAHLEDNLLTIDSGLLHDGVVAPEDEDMSPTTERLAVYLWLNLIDERLPLYVARVYAHELQSKTLKDLQPLISDSMDLLLQELNTQEDISIQYSRSSRDQYQRSTVVKRRPANSGSVPSRYSGSVPSRSNMAQSCIFCKSAGRQFLGHTIGSCWHLSKFDKSEISKALRVHVHEEDDFEHDLHEFEDTNSGHPEDFGQVISNTSTIAKVHCSPSPSFYVYYKHHPCHIVVDTGATSSLISKAFVRLCNIKVLPTSQSARTVDKTPLKVQGEVHLILCYGNTELQITALVVDSLDSDILGGTPFCEQNGICLNLSDKIISFSSHRISYGARPKQTVHNGMHRNQSVTLRNTIRRVLMPGDFIEIKHDNLSTYEGEVAIEPRLDSPLQGQWPIPEISRIISGTIRISNQTQEPIALKRAQHLAHIQKVIAPELQPDINAADRVPARKHQERPFSKDISVDPDKQLTPDERQMFTAANLQFDNVFNPQFGAYNDNSGTIRANINMGSVKPPSRKGKLPFYSQGRLRTLQDESDRLEALGVLGKPEDVGVPVEFVSPSFKKTTGGDRFVTAFNDLSQYTKLPPTVSSSCADVLRKLASFKYIIKSDLTKSFYQIPLAKSAIPYLGTVTPFKGLRVYLRAAMGMPGASEWLQELLSRVLGDYMREGFVILKEDDLNVCGNEVLETLHNWIKVLKRFQDNNLSLSASKTVICPTTTTILGWVWSSGTLSISPHKIAPLATVTPPATCSTMRSFIGAVKAMSKCIPKYASLLSPLEDSIKGLEGKQSVTWTSDLHQAFLSIQDALRSTRTLTIPKPSDKLIMTVDASPSNNGLGATLFVVRDDKKMVAEFFSFKMKTHQTNWIPCEHEALAIATGVNHFSPYLRESEHPLLVYTDSKPCVQAYYKLTKGHFSASARISTFLSTLSSYRVKLSHIKGEDNIISDFSSRNPSECGTDGCQICKFVYETSTSVVNAISVSDVLSGTISMPYTNTSAWKSAQHECLALRRLFAHLSEGTRPAKKARNLKDLRRYLLVASINPRGLLVVNKPDQYLQNRELIIVPKSILPGLLTALHLQLSHPSIHQMKKVFSRYFYGLGFEHDIQHVVDACDHCASLKTVSPELFSQGTTTVPDCPGKLFTADVIHRSRQRLFVVRDVFSSYTSGTIITDVTASSLRKALLTHTALFRLNPCDVHTDNASGFQALLNDSELESAGVRLQFGHVKNKNKNCVVDRAIQELERELLKELPQKEQLSSNDLQHILDILNTRVRNRNLSAKEILFQRDMITGNQLSFTDKELSEQQEKLRTENHLKII